MNLKTHFILGLLLLSLTAWSQQKIDNPVLPSVADAGVMKYNGRYYIGGVHTLGDFYVSTDLVDWGKPVHVVTMNNDWATPFGVGNEQIHANDMHYINGIFHLYWSVNHWGRERNIVHIVHAEATNPLGPYTEPVKERWLDNRIDPHLFIDDDGKMYLYMVKFTDGNTIWARPMHDPRTFEGNAKYMFASQGGSWETLDNRVEEGPWVIKYRDRYYLMYNTNHTATEWGNYMLGVAEASDPLAFNHGNKYAHPVVKSNQLELEETYVDLLKYQDKGMFYYSFEPTSNEWYKPGQDLSRWKKGKTGFGFPITENSTTQKVKTIWNTETCRLLKPFTYDKAKNGNLSMRLHHTGAAKVYLNGNLIYTKENGDYLHIDLSKQKNLLVSGDNLLAIEGHPGRRNRFLDVALFDMKDQIADDILYTPGQPNILRGPNGFEWWLIYMANKNAEQRSQYINRVHFFDKKLVVDGITGINTPGYHPVPNKPTYQYLSNNNQALPIINQTLPSTPATNYFFEAGIKSSASNASEDGIIAWMSDDNNWLKIVLDDTNKKWKYIINQNGKQEMASFPLPGDFKANVFHTISLFKNHTCFTLRIDDRPAPGKTVIETSFTGKGLPGIYSGNSNASFDGIAYTIGWDEYDEHIKGWNTSEDMPGLRLKGDLLDSYEVSAQISASSGNDLARMYPVYVDKDHYVEATFDFAARQFSITEKSKGKAGAAKNISMTHLQTHYVNNVFSDMMERHFKFDSPTMLDAVFYKKESIHQNDTIIEDLRERFHVYAVKDGNWQELSVKYADSEHPGYSRIEFPPIETTELIFVPKTTGNEISIQEIRINELFKKDYNLRVVKNKKSMLFFVDGKQVYELPAKQAASRVGIISSKGGTPLKAITLFQTVE
ncbi:hypothetical protein AGMMS49574_04250 [Bacteroidia bacterium]|nr:hypothetical protein AGMMS49574_04250 [Bacteroidia bacterium]